METYENFDFRGFIDMISIYGYMFTVISLEIFKTTVFQKNINIIFTLRLRINFELQLHCVCTIKSNDGNMCYGTIPWGNYYWYMLSEGGVKKGLIRLQVRTGVVVVLSKNFIILRKGNYDFIIWKLISVVAICLLYMI